MAPLLSSLQHHDLGILPIKEQQSIGGDDTGAPLKVGVERPILADIGVDASDLRNSQSRTRTETNVGGGLLSRHGENLWTWTTAVRSPGADVLRARFAVTGSAGDSRAYIYANDGQVRGPYLLGDIAVNSAFWSNSLAGDQMFIEVQIEPTNEDFSFEVESVAHISNPAVRPQPEGEECLSDVSCSQTPENTQLIEWLSTSTAQLNFMVGGNAYVCSGSLITDTDTSTYIPYLLTANHCFATQAAASSLEAVWRWRSTTCGGQLPSYGSLPRSLGATLLATSPTSDFTLVRLNQSAPTGSALMGWDPNTVSGTTRFYRVAHPSGGPQKFSVTDNIAAPLGLCTGVPTSSYLYQSEVFGGTAGGSSGAPISDVNGRIRGQLLGKCGSNLDDPCDHTANDTVDGRFSVTYPSVSSFLAPSTSITCVPNLTTACMLSNRFKVQVRFRSQFDNAPSDSDAKKKSVTGFANPNYETAFFYFNSESNIEAMVKMLDQGNTDGSGRPTIAVLTGSATPLRIEVTIQDTKTGTTKKYTSEFGKQAGQTDFTAFLK